MDHFTITTSQHQEMIDITEHVNGIIQGNMVKEGLCTIYVPHATAGITINENADPNVMIDILKVLNSLVPEHDNYLHDRIDNNAAAHIKSSLMGVSTTIPFKDGKLLLGTWQQVMLCEFDGPKHRKVYVTLR